MQQNKGAQIEVDIEEIRRWLADDTGESRPLQKWLRETDTTMSGAILSAFANGIIAPYHFVPVIHFGLLLVAVSIYMGCVQGNSGGILSEILFFVGLVISICLAGLLKNCNAPGVRAALLLAEREDKRAIAPLARTWTTYWWTNDRQQSSHQAALLSLLTQHSHQARKQDESLKELHRLVFRAWKAALPTADLSEKDTDLLLAALRYLWISEEETSQKIVARFATFRTNKPNRTLIVETARAFQHPVVETVPLSVTVPAQPSPLLQRNGRV